MYVRRWEITLAIRGTPGRTQTSLSPWRATRLDEGRWNQRPRQQQRLGKGGDINHGVFRQQTWGSDRRDVATLAPGASPDWTVTIT